MISPDPSGRPTFDTLLHTSRGTVFPESLYSFLHNYVSTINELPTPGPFVVNSPQLTNLLSAPHTVSSTPSVVSTTRSTPVSTFSGTANDSSNDALPSDSDHRMERIWADYESVEPYLAPDAIEETTMDVKVDYTTATATSKSFQVCFLYFPLSSYSMCCIGYPSGGITYT